MIGFTETGGLALFLCKGFDHTDTWNDVGQHVGNLGPNAVHLLKTGSQSVANIVNHPGDDGQGKQGDHSQPGMDGKKDDRREDDHQNVRGKIQQVKGEKKVDAVGFRTDAGHQITGALVAEVFQRQMQQVLEGSSAQVTADSLGHHGQDIGARPAKTPGKQGGAQQAAKVKLHQLNIDGLAVLERDQHVVHQRHGQVRGYQGSTGGGQRQHKTRQQTTFVRPGKSP